MSTNDRPLAEHLSPTVDTARLERQWANIATRSLGRSPGRRISFRFAMAGAVAIALIVFAVTWMGARPTATTVTDRETIVMPEGSRVSVARGADVRVQKATGESVELSVQSGIAEFDVTHVAGRSFVVHGGGYDAIVIGTRFSVGVDQARRTAMISVKEGRVRVVGHGTDRVVSAGETWSGPIEAAPPAVTVPPSASAALPTPIDADDRATSADAGSVEIVPSASPARIAQAPIEGPKELLARATTARQEGRPRDAAAAFDALRRRHRSDARAGLAAFELGRIRLDSLSDPAGAAEAFADAVVLAPDAPFREDAEARRVEALDRVGDTARCEAARAGYLARYPTGIHARQVAGRCTKR